MSFFDFSIENFTDSNTIANAISDNIVPKDGINIIGTTTAARGYAGQTLSSVDLISAASGKDLLASGVYGNMHRLSMTRENLSSLVTSVLGNSDDSLSVLSRKPGSADADGNPAVLRGQAAALQIIAGTSLGREYSDGMLEGFRDLLQAKYSGSLDSGNDMGPGAAGSDGPVSAGENQIAFKDELTNIPRAAYQLRGKMLKSVINLEGGSELNGFNFDIENTLKDLKYDSSTIFPGVTGSGSGSLPIPQQTIANPIREAYVSAALMECLIFLASDNSGQALDIRGGFGTGTGANTSQQGDNRSPAKSGGSITDHAFGRAFDIKYVSKQDVKLPAMSSTKEAYLQHLNSLLQGLSTAPQHLLPDVILVNKFVGSDYANNSNNGTISKISVVNENLKYVKITLTDTGHTDHIHMAFAPQRGGVYTSTDGDLQMVGGSSGNDSSGGTNPGGGTLILRPGANISSLSRVYTNNDTLTKLDIYTLLKEYGNFSAEISALLTAICERESSFRPRALNEYGFLGLFQIGTGTTKTDGGYTLSVDLEVPTSESILIWKLALSDLKDQALTEDQARVILSARAKSTNRADLYASFDERVWIPINQIRMLRAKMGLRRYSATVSEVGGEYIGKGDLRHADIFSPWGERFLEKGWMSKVDYRIAEAVYVMAGNGAGKLKDWVLSNIGKTSRAWNKFTDSEHSGKTIIEAWTNGEVELGIRYGETNKDGVFTPTQSAISVDKWY